MAMLYGVWGKSLEEFKQNYKQELENSSSNKTIPIASVEGTKIKLIQLTDKGKAKAEELLNVK